MGDVLKFPSPETIDLPELTNEQIDLILLLGADPANCRFTELSGFTHDNEQPVTTVLPSVMWRGHIRVIFPDGNVIIRDAIAPRG